MSYINILFISFLSSIVLLGTVVLLAITYYALKAKRQAFDVLKTKKNIHHSTILQIDDSRVTFRSEGPHKYLATLPTVGIYGKSGNLVVNGAPVIGDGFITRQIAAKNGIIGVGEQVNIDLFVYQSNPKESLNIEYCEITFSSEISDLKAWSIPTDSNNWVICIHGHRSNRRESLRYAKILKNLKMNQLYITYRNDEDINISTKGYHMFGLTEWKDLQSAVNYVKEQSPDNIFFLGHSMGGAIAFNFLLQSRISNQVTGVILESPALDLNEIISYQAAKLPLLAQMFLNPVKFMLAKIVGIKWSDFDYISKSAGVHTPVLLIHSENDETVPVCIGDRLAHELPEVVTYLRLEGAPHAAAWNYSQNEVEESVTQFIDTLT
tara:strand:+ start:4747 stop:5883 length:1137 start_codon:yes stop_codon:yes gene_type:complete